MGYPIGLISRCPVAAYDRANHLEKMLEDDYIDPIVVSDLFYKLAYQFNWGMEDVLSRASLLYHYKYPQDFIRNSIISAVWMARGWLEHWRKTWSWFDDPGPMTKSWEELREEHKKMNALCSCVDGVSD